MGQLVQFGCDQFLQYLSTESRYKATHLLTGFQLQQFLGLALEYATVVTNFKGRLMVEKNATLRLRPIAAIGPK